MSQRKRFIDTYREEVYSMTELCERFGISRKTGYKWLRRFEREGYKGLKDRSRRPQSSPKRTAEEVADLIIAAHYEREEGAKKLLAILSERHPEIDFPSVSTAHRILKRDGLVGARRRKRPKGKHPPVKPITTTAPNDVWTADFKGEFLLDSPSRTYCYPLTVVDHHSRFLLGCEALTSTAMAPSRQHFRRLFAEYGLPTAIRTDNGVPFASPVALHRLSRLSVYWIKLDIRVEHIAPGRPSQNGAHERMHRTLKAKTTRPPEKTLGDQQRRFDDFREDFNHVRPHEALGLKPPARVYQPSSRALPSRLPEPNYPAYAEVRRVADNGCIKYRGWNVWLTEVLAGEPVALIEVDDHIWDIRFHDVLLGRLDERTNTFVP